MYLALGLSSWMLMYALSTMTMNHRHLFRSPPQWQAEKQETYQAAFAEGADPRLIGGQILAHLGLEGRFNASRQPGGRIQVTRHDPVAPRRISYTPADGKLVVERMVFRAPAFLERMHRRRGYGTGPGLEDTWAFSVDLVIGAMIFWVLSGLWMWWEMKATRGWGLLTAALGLGLFTVFLKTI